MSGPYLKAADDDGELVPLELRMDEADMAQCVMEAQELLIKAGAKPSDLPSTTVGMSSEQITAMHRYYAAVKENPGVLARIPSYKEYMEEVCPDPKRAKVSNPTEEGEDNGGMEE